MRHRSSHCRTESSAFSWSARRLHAPAAASVSRDRACASFARSSHALGDRYPAPCTADFGVAPRCFASSVNVAKTSLTWTETSPAARCSSFVCRQRAMLSSTSDTRSRPPGLSMSSTCRHVASGRHFRSICSIRRSLRLALGNGLHGKNRSIRLGIAVTVTENAFFQSSISPDPIAGGVSIPHRCNSSSACVMACARSPSDSIRTDRSSKRRLTRSPSDFKSRLACSASRADDHLSNSTSHSGGVSRSPAANFRMRSSPACHVARSSGEPWRISSSTVRGSVTPAPPSAVSRACCASVIAWSSLLRSSSSMRCCCSKSGFLSIHARTASSDSSTVCLVRARRRAPNPCRRHSCSRRPASFSIASMSRRSSAYATIADRACSVIFCGTLESRIFRNASRRSISGWSCASPAAGASEGG